MKIGCIQFIISTAAIIIGLVAATIGNSLFTDVFQARACYDYAREKALPDIEHLRFSSVSISTNQSRSHSCTFIDTRTGLPVFLKFDPEDVPVALDTAQVLCMAVLFLVVSVVVWGVGHLVTRVPTAAASVGSRGT